MDHHGSLDRPQSQRHGSNVQRPASVALDYSDNGGHRRRQRGSIGYKLIKLLLFVALACGAVAGGWRGMEFLTGKQGKKTVVKKRDQSTVVAQAETMTEEAKVQPKEKPHIGPEAKPKTKDQDKNDKNETERKLPQLEKTAKGKLSGKSPTDPPRLDLNFTDVCQFVGKSMLETRGGERDLVEEGMRRDEKYVLLSGRFLAVEGQNAIAVCFPPDKEGMFAGIAFLSSEFFSVPEKDWLLQLLQSAEGGVMDVGRFRAGLSVAGKSLTWEPSHWIRIDLEPVNANGIAKPPRMNALFEGLLDHPKYGEVNRFVDGLLRAQIQPKELEAKLYALNTLADQAGITGQETLRFVRDAHAAARKKGLNSSLGIEAALGGLSFQVALNENSLKAWRAKKGKQDEVHGRPPARSMSDLVAVLRDAKSSPSSRLEAVQALGAMGKTAAEAIPDLIECLKDPSAAMQVACLLTLGNVGLDSPVVMPVVLGFLEHSDPVVRSSAVLALAKSKALDPKMKEYVPLLADLLSEPQAELRYAAAMLLERLKEDAAGATEALAKALQDKDARVRLQAVAAIGAIGPPAKAAVPKLVSALLEEPLREPIVRALGKIGEPAVFPLIRSLTDNRPAIRLLVMDALAEIGPPAKSAIPALKLRMQTDIRQEVRTKAALTIRRIQASQ